MKRVQITIKVENNKEETNLYDELIKEIKALTPTKSNVELVCKAIREAYPDEGFEYSFLDTDKSVKDLFEDLMAWGDDGLLHDFKTLIESVKLGYCNDTQHLMRYIDCDGESQYRDYQSFLNEMANPNEFYFWEHCIPTMLKVIRRGV